MAEKQGLKRTLPRPQELATGEHAGMIPQVQGVNGNLRTQVESLLDMLEQYTFKIYLKKSEKYKVAKYEPDENLKDKDKTLFQLGKQNKTLKRDIGDLRRQLSESYNLDKLVEMENDILVLKQRLALLEEEERLISQNSDGLGRDDENEDTVSSFNFG